MKKCLLLFTLFLSFGMSFAQTKDSLSLEEQERRQRNIEAGNPFKKFGYTPKIATLSKGKYLEWHDLDSIVRIGSYSFHVKKKDITGYNMDEDKNSESTLRPELTSRWLSPDPLAEEFPEWSPYNFVLNNPLRYTDPTGLAPEDWIRNRYGDYLWDDNAVSPETTRGGWEYVGKELPKGVDRLQVLTEIDGQLYHKNTTNLLASIGNFFGGDFVEHKPYDPVTENMLKEGINTGAGMVAGGLVFKGVSRAFATTFTSNATKVGLNITDDFFVSATNSSGKQGLTNVGRALQKHAGREGSTFSNIKFSHKTANDDGLRILNEIISTPKKNLIIQNAKQGGTEIFNKATGQGFSISRNGQFNGFRELTP